MVSCTLCPAVHISGSLNVNSRAKGIADHYWPQMVFFRLNLHQYTVVSIHPSVCLYIGLALWSPARPLWSPLRLLSLLIASSWAFLGSLKPFDTLLKLRLPSLLRMDGRTYLQTNKWTYGNYSVLEDIFPIGSAAHFQFGRVFFFRSPFCACFRSQDNLM